MGRIYGSHCSALPLANETPRTFRAPGSDRFARNALTHACEEFPTNLRSGLSRLGGWVDFLAAPRPCPTGRPEAPRAGSTGRGRRACAAGDGPSARGPRSQSYTVARRWGPRGRYTSTGMKTPFRILMILLCGLQSSFAKLSPDDRAAGEVLYRQIGGPFVNKYRDGSRALLENERGLVIEMLRDRIEEISRRSPKDAEDETRPIVLDMAILGDDRALNQYVNWFVEHDARGIPDAILTIKNARVIPLMGEALFRQDEGKIVGDLGFVPTQWTVAEVMLHNLRNSAEFSDDVANWARRIGPGNHVKMMRDWYRANEAKLKAREFKAVQPGAEPPKPKQSISVDTQPPSPPLPAAPSPSNLKPLGNPPASGHSGNSYLWIGAILLAICGCLVWLLRRKRERKL